MRRCSVGWFATPLSHAKRGKNFGNNLTHLIWQQAMLRKGSVANITVRKVSSSQCALVAFIWSFGLSTSVPNRNDVQTRSHRFVLNHLCSEVPPPTRPLSCLLIQHTWTWYSTYIRGSVLAPNRENKKEVVDFCLRQQRLRIHEPLFTNGNPFLGSISFYM